MKKKLFYSLSFSALVAVAASFWASTSPDGLDKVSELLGFGTRGVERTAVMTDYSVPFISISQLSTVAAGVLGILIVFGIFSIMALIFHSPKSPKGDF